MMDGLLRAAGSLILLALIYSLLETILPEGSLSRFVRLVMGLTLLAAVLGRFSGGLPDFAGLLPETGAIPAYAAAEEAGEDYAEQGLRLREELTRQARQEQEERLSAQLAAVAAAAEGVNAARAEVTLNEDGGLEQAVIRVTPAAGADPEAVERRVRELVCGFCLLDGERVCCQVTEGE
ncbi:MAG: stage III sporulation protein AF [Firmicutes bacterium]|nr:stage III sporulation protein AF [Bacillota bacterium]